jgi:hypothetical protein
MGKNHIRSFFFFVLLLNLLSGGCTFQKKYFSCDYYELDTSSSTEIFKIVKGNKIENQTLDSLINLLTSLSFPYKGFEVVADNTGKVEVAKAIIDFYKGYRYIAINPERFKSTNLDDPKKAASMLGVLAHELGHLTFSHVKSSHKNEILADEFAGWLLNKLGIAREYCTQSLDDFIPQGKEEKSKTHPSKLDRKKAVYIGWDRANIDGKKNYSVCCDLSFFSSFTVEGLFLTNSVNAGNPCFIDFSMTTYNQKGEVVQDFGKNIRSNLIIKPEINEPIVLFKNLSYAIHDKRFYKFVISICECGEPCNGNNDSRECPTIKEILTKDIGETLEVDFEGYGFLKLRFKK